MFFISFQLVSNFPFPLLHFLIKTAVMGKLLHFLFLCLLLTGVSAAFAPKKREHAFKRQQEAQNPATKQQQDAIAAAAAAYCSEESCYPPPFAIAQAAASMAPAQQQDLDDDLVVGYGTGVLACVVSLALGFSLGYVTI
jgi:hypothetical protein